MFERLRHKRVVRKMSKMQGQTNSPEYSNLMWRQAKLLAKMARKRAQKKNKDR